MKKTICLILVTLMLALPLASCGEKLQLGFETVTFGVTGEIAETLLYYLTVAFTNREMKAKTIKYDTVEQAYDALAADEIDFVFAGNKLECAAYNEAHDDSLLVIDKVYYHCYALFPDDSNERMKDIKDGAHFAIPDSGADRGRALQLLNALELITLKEGVGLDATLDSVDKNPRNFTFIQLPVSELAKNVANYDFTVMCSDIAVANGFPINHAAIAIEEVSAEGAIDYAITLACRRSEINTELVKDMQGFFNSARVYDTIDDYDDHEIFAAFSLT